jgi:DNA replication and repair protein RecF
LGKTNLLDGIYYLCFTRSYFSKSDQQQVRSGSEGFRLEAHCRQNDAEHRLLCILRENGKKEFSVDGQLYSRLSDHIGRFPAVIVAPDDIQMITGGSEERRRYLDTLLCQMDHRYLQHLSDYNKILQQRNSLLRASPARGPKDNGLLDTYDVQLNGPVNYIFEKRREFTRRLLPLIISFYLQISGQEEPVRIEYESQLLDGSFQDLVRASREKDLILQRTSVGIHRDDLLLSLQDNPFRNRASQGQRKSFLFAMKLAAFQLLRDAFGFSPVLLLDDVFEKLDMGRMNNLLCWICKENDGQLFITDTDAERVKHHLQSIGADYQQIGLTE